MAPQLMQIEEFREILKDYSVSEEGKKVLEGLHLVVLVGPSSTGRNTVIRELMKKDGYHYVVSDTTRPPRINDGKLEQDGHEYHFRSEDEVLDDLKEGRFLEAELIHNQQVSGISLRELQKAKQQKMIAIADMELGGITNLMKTKPDTIAIMMLPPSFEEWQRRMASRGHMSEQELRRRLDTAVKIFDHGLANNYYHFVVADNVEHTAASIDGLAHGGANPQEGRAREILHDLKYQLEQKLESMRFI